MKTTSSILFSSAVPSRQSNFMARLLGTAALAVALLGGSALPGATILFQATNTAVVLGLPAAQLELPKPLTGKEKILDYKVLDWRDADYTAGSPPSYADWTVFTNTSYIDGNPSEIWMRQQGQRITTTTTVSSTVVSVHMTGDDNDGLGEILIDDTTVARLNTYNWPLSQTVLIIASNLSFGTHVVVVKDVSVTPGLNDVHTFGAAALRATNSSPKWVQPPVAGETTNVFLGWNEVSGGHYYPPFQIASDDWVCTNNHPITALRWWGSYPGWTGMVPPPNAPALFNFCIWTDVPKQPAANPFSHPGQVIWQFSSANVGWKFVGWDYDPRSGTYEACFEYYQALPQAQWFYQDPLLGTNIYWLSIAAPLQAPGPVWGWKTVPRNTNAPSPDAAVRIFNPLNPVLGSPYVAGQEINFPTNGNPWDLAFQLISSSSNTVAKWTQPPDLTQTGMDVNDTLGQPPFLLADDFQCTNSEPLTQITVWGSWREDLLPANNPANVQFSLSIHADIPSQGTIPSQPGALLWSKIFPPGQFQVVTQQVNILEWWMDPPAGAFFPGDRTCYKYTFTMAATEAFVQQGTPQNPIIYWLDVQATVIAGTSSAAFGWKTSLRNWNDAAVWANAVEPPPYPGPWNALAYPPNHPMGMPPQPVNLAFALGSSDEVTEIKWSQPPMRYTPPNTFNGWNESSVYGSTSLAADDWLCTSSRPVTDIHWWGSLLGWSNPNSPPMPDAFRFSIWTDVPKQAGLPFSHPGTVIWQTVSTNFDWVFAGWDVDPQNPTALPEACFKFDVDLDPPDWFYQEPGKHIYWISIAAIYNAGQTPAYPWGWKTRPRDTNSPAPDAAVRITVPTAPTLGSVYQQGGAIEFPAGASWDMAFELTTQPALDFGDAPDPPFPTLLKNNGARHTIITGIQLGQNIDGESNGQPNATATGDNVNPPTWPNDEDGVTFVGNMVPGQNYTIQVVASTNAYLQAWIDFTADGTWATPGDQICSDTALVAGNNSITFLVPANAAWGTNVFARFRFSTVTNLFFIGAAPDGEVEDYLLPIEPRPEHDLGDAPDSHNHAGAIMTAYPKGGPPGVIANYPTVFIVNQPPYGPIHMQPKAVAFLGRNVSLEWNADVMADEDFVNNILPATDRPDLDGLDDGVLFPLALPHCRPTSFQYVVTANAPFQQFYLNVWFDWNRNGNWNDILPCPDGNNAPEWAVQNQPVNLLGPGPYPYVFTNTTPPFRSWHPYITNTPVWMRVTLSEQTWPPGGGALPQGGEGPANGYYYGETEDYYLTAYKTANEFDFGDAPSPYPTLLAGNGAQHQVVPGFNFGRFIDFEADGLPHSQALGDDLNGSADEDGISWTTAPVLGSNACVNVVLTSGPAGGFLDAWFDFNKNGIWGDQPAERIFVSQALASGANPGLCFPVPTNAVLGTNFARFRLTSVGAIGPTGPFIDGEVEDHQVLIQQRRPLTNIVITSIVVTNLVTPTLTGQVVTAQWNAESGIIYQMCATTNLAGAPTNLFWTDVGGVVIGPANTQRETNTTTQERYYRVVAPYTLP